MKRTRKVHRIYLVLRHFLGDQLPAHVVLKASSAMVELFSRREPFKRLRLENAPPTFDELPLDEAFADGGWRVLAREAHWSTEEPEQVMVTNRMKHLTMGLAA